MTDCGTITLVHPSPFLRTLCLEPSFQQLANRHWFFRSRDQIQGWCHDDERYPRYALELIQWTPTRSSKFSPPTFRTINRITSPRLIPGSYGSLARFKNLERLKAVNKYTLVGAGGEYSDFQAIQKMLEHISYACCSTRHSLISLPHLFLLFISLPSPFSRHQHRGLLRRRRQHARSVRDSRLPVARHVWPPLQGRPAVEPGGGRRRQGRQDVCILSLCWANITSVLSVSRLAASHLEHH